MKVFHLYQSPFLLTCEIDITEDLYSELKQLLNPDALILCSLVITAVF